jgi:hypothetical protein
MNVAQLDADPTAVITEKKRFNPGRAWPYVAICALFVLLGLFTRSPSLNDTVYYAQDLESSLACPAINRCPQLWDAGHLFWRPLGHILFSPTLPLLSRLVAGTRLEATLLLMILSGLALLVSALLLHRILTSETENAVVSFFVSVSFLCTLALLYAFHSGTSYPTGLSFLIAALWLARKGCQARKMIFLGSAGLCAGLSVAFWLPYVVALPALLCWVLFESGERRMRMAAVLVLSTGIAGIVFFGLGAHAGGVESFSEFGKWLQDSGHATQQNRNLVRSLLGFPRAFLDMGQFGTKMKQFLLRNVGAKTSFSELFLLGIWKIALFYAALTSLLWLWRTLKGRRALVTFLVALSTTMALAISFEGGSLERYLPLYPFFFLAAAQCLILPAVPRVARYCVAALFVVVMVGNLPTVAVSRIHARQDGAARRLLSLPNIPPGSVVYVLPNDELSFLWVSAPFNQANRNFNAQILGIYQPMMGTAFWKRDFANRVLRVWNQGGQVWVTTRVWSEQPQAEWNWVEGDDPNIMWNSMAQFFRGLDRDASTRRGDGFSLLSRSLNNEKLFTGFVDD